MRRLQSSGLFLSRGAKKARFSPPQPGFTLVELLVVIAIIGMLMGLVVPAVMRAKEQANRMKCASNSRNLAMAASSYEQRTGSYPGYLNPLQLTNGKYFTNPVTNTPQGVSWVVVLLNDLEQPGLAQAWRTPIGTANAADVNSALVSLEILTCPSNPPTVTGGTPNCYAVNTGCIDVTGTAAKGGLGGIPQDWAGNGIFFDRYTNNPRINTSGSRVPMVEMTSGLVRDGLGQTIIIAENQNARDYASSFPSALVAEASLGVIWDITAPVTIPATPPGGGTVFPSMTPTKLSYMVNNSVAAGDAAKAFGQPPTGSTAYDYSRPSSSHGDGITVSFCDGHTTFLSDQISYYVYCLLCSSNGAAVNKPGQNTALTPNNFNRPIDPAWFRP